MSVLSHLDGLASNLNLAEREASNISTSIATVSQRLSSFFGADVKDKIQFGSSTRGTALPRRADQYSDVDYMVVFDNSNGYRPQTFIDRLKRFAEFYYASSEIRQSHPTVVLSLNHISFDLVPAYRSFWSGLQIPGPKSGYAEWMSTDPNGFNTDVNSANAQNNYKIKPLIRVLKYWNAQNGYVYNSYELEQHLARATYWWCSNLKEYLFSAVASLPAWRLSATAAGKVHRAREIVARIKLLESSGEIARAEMEIERLVPFI